ncbi:MAG: protein phosphatase 2C domain-containing protein, partial [Candidatus Tectomicrobia bacterium]|nr:protein phosphatase 2C domain-containing protein [Candidatus Tectomicrobia bacterium]
MEWTRLRSAKTFFRQVAPDRPDAAQPPHPEAEQGQAHASNPTDSPSTPVSSQTPDTSPAPSPQGHKKLAFFGLSDPGLKRDNNEDHFIVADLTRHTIAVNNNQLIPSLVHHNLGANGTLLAVADGLGGHDDGEIASHIAVEALVHTLFDIEHEELSIADKLSFAVQAAHKSIGRYIGRVPGSRSMSSTLTAVHIGSDEMTIAQVGDSRAYLFADGTLTQLTEDQTLVHMMLKKGLLTEEEAESHPDRNVILQALGQGRQITPDVQTFPLNHGNCLLLCSDGLSSYVPHERIETILKQETRGDVRCKLLLE